MKPVYLLFAVVINVILITASLALMVSGVGETACLEVIRACINLNYALMGVPVPY